MPRGLSSIAGESEEGSSETLTRKTTQEKKTSVHKSILPLFSLRFLYSTLTATPLVGPVGPVVHFPVSDLPL